MSFLSVEGCQGSKEGKRQRYLLTQNFISGFNDHSVGGKFFLKPVKMVASPRQGVQIYEELFSVVYKVEVCDVLSRCLQ